MKFLFDANLSEHLPKIIGDLSKEAGEVDEYIHLKKRFSCNVKDSDFIPVLENEGGWIIVTCDKGRNDPDKEAWRTTSLTIVILSRDFANVTIYEQVSLILKYWSKIRESVQRFPTGSVLGVSRKGIIKKK